MSSFFLNANELKMHVSDSERFREHLHDASRLLVRVRLEETEHCISTKHFSRLYTSMYIQLLSHTNTANAR